MASPSIFQNFWWFSLRLRKVCAEGCEELSSRWSPGHDYLLWKCSLVSSAVCKQDARLFSEGLLANKADKSLSPSGAASLWPRFLFWICLFELGLLYYVVEGLHLRIFHQRCRFFLGKSTGFAASHLHTSVSLHANSGLHSLASFFYICGELPGGRLHPVL